MSIKIRLTQSSEAKPKLVRASIDEILQHTALLSLATAKGDSVPHINNCYFHFTTELCLGFLSFADTRHIRNVRVAENAAVGVASTSQIWGQPIKGVQFQGRVRDVLEQERTSFFEAYSKRFPAASDYCDELLKSRSPSDAQPFLFEASHFTLVDEERFGEETFIHGTVLTTGARV